MYSSTCIYKTTGLQNVLILADSSEVQTAKQKCVMIPSVIAGKLDPEVKLWPRTSKVSCSGVLALQLKVKHLFFGGGVK